VTYDNAIQLEPLAFHYQAGRTSAEEAITRLVEQKQELLKQIRTLQSIAPKRIMAPDGKVYVWHCPDELVPIMDATL
jgi:hypothetical protein